MSESLNLELPYLAEAQAQKHVTVNDALRRIDLVVQLAVLDRTLSAPPASPLEGSRYIVAAGPIGDWSGHGREVAAYVDGYWTYFDPKPGWLAYVEAEDAVVYFDGSEWRALAATGSGGETSQEVERLGVNSASDGANRLVVASRTALFKPDSSGADGSGDVQLVLSKDGASDVASHVFQKNYSGRAEFGLIGSDDFSLKVSADGSEFKDAFRVSRADGQLDFAMMPTVAGEEALAFSSGSRAQARSQAIPARIDVVMTRGYASEGDGGGGTYLRVASPAADGLGFTDSAGGHWALAGERVTARQAGAVGDGATNDTSALRRAFASGRDVELGHGVFMVTNVLTTGREYQRILGSGRGRTILRVDTGFNLGAAGVVQIAHAYVTVEHFTVEFDQQSAETRADLRRYPPAVNMEGRIRCRLSGLRFERAYDGVLATGNCGGSIFDDVESGSFNIGFHLGGSLDTVELSNARVWPYGFAGDETLLGIYSDGETIGYRIGRVDDLKMANCTPFRARVVLEESGTGSARGAPFGTITGLALDGSYSRLEMSAGHITISSLYGTTAAGDDTFITLTGGDLVVSDFTFRTGNTSSVPMVLVDGAGASCQIQNGRANFAGPDAQGFRVDAGQLSVSSVRFALPANDTRTGACIRQDGGSLTAFGNSATAVAGGSGPFVEIANDGDHMVFGNDSNGWDFLFPPTRRNGLYGPNQGGSEVIISSVVTFAPVNAGNEGGEIRLAGAGSNGDIRLDNFAGNLRLLGAASGSTLDVVEGTVVVASLGGEELSLAGGLRLSRGGADDGDSVALGGQSMRAATTGTANTAVGQRALHSLGSGSENVAVGTKAGEIVTGASGNTFLGHACGETISGSDNTGLGRNAFAGSSAGISNSTALGAGAAVTGSNQVQLGDPSTTTYTYGAVQTRSDARDKADVRDTVLGLDFVRGLRPVDFRWDYREAYERPAELPDDLPWSAPTAGSLRRKRYHHGLLAQEVKALSEAMGVDFGGYQDHELSGGRDVKSIGYDELIAPLIKAVQELADKVSALEEQR